MTVRKSGPSTIEAACRDSAEFRADVGDANRGAKV